MSNAKTSISRRFLAALLSFVLVLGLLPTSTLTAFAATAEHPDAITVSVTDQDGKALAGVTVAYSVSSTANGDDYASGTVTTDANGCVEVLAKDKYVADDLTLSATAALTDYVYADGSGRIEGAAITSDTQDFVIQLRSTKIPGVTVAANSGLVYQKGTAQSLVTVAGINEQTDTVIYKIDGEDVAEPKRENAGTYAVEVTVQRDGYSDFVFSENVTIAKAEITDIVIAEVTAPYNEKDQNIVALTGKFLKDDDVHWYVNGSDTGSAEIPQAIAVGKYAVRLTVNRGNNYELFDKTVNSEIVLGNIDLGDLKITANELTYNGNDQEAITVNNQGNYTLQYRLSETESWKKYDKAAGTVPTVKNAGDYTVYIKAVKDSYNGKEYPEFPLNVHVEKAGQNIAFSTDVPTTVELTNDSNKNRYDFSAGGNNLSGQEIEYTLIDASGTDIAEIDASNGTLTVKHAGIVTVKAFRAGNKNYKDAEAYSTVVITAPQSGLVDFDNKTVNYVLDESGVSSEQQAAKVNADDNGAVTYSIDQTNIGLSIDTNSGKITVTNWNKLGRAMRKTGSVSVIVTAKKAAGKMTAKEWTRNGETWASQDVTYEVYPATVTSYKLVITYEAAPDFDAVCNVTSSDPKTGWYNSEYPATVTPKDSKRYSIAVDDPIGFADEQTITAQGEDSHYIYLKDKTTRKICAAIELKIKIDTVAPNTDDMTISYSRSIPVDKILSTITFGYYNPDVTVTFTAKDETSGLDHMDWKYTKEANASDINLLKDGGPLTFDKNGQAVLTLTASELEQYRGNISFTVTDKAGNTSDVKTDDDHVIVIDTIPPKCSVSYADPLNIHDGKKYFDGSIELNFTVTEANFYEEDFKAFVSKNGESKAPVSLSWEKSAEEKDTYIGTYMLSGDGDYVVSAEYKDRSNNEMAKYQSDVLVVDTIAPTMTVMRYSEASNQVGTTRYYGNDKSGMAEIAFNVTEANFFAEDVVVKVSRNGETAVAVSPSWTDVSADEHIGRYTLSGDGHYIVSVEYKDRSNNEMASYTSDMITIDTIKPVINVVYQNNMKIDTLRDNDGSSRDYFDKTQTAVVTITEHNFNPKEVDFQIVGKDVAGEKRNVNDLISMSEWRSNGDAHVITITYSGDANYTFDVDYSDLAKNAAEDYAADHFTIDTVAPRVTGVSYSTSILETVLSNITFGFYNAKMTVTITAEDDTAGVHKFDYSYLTAAGVSSVNAQLLNQAIDEADIKYSNGGKTASMTFEIPKMVLGSDNQFNGTVEFDVIDRSGNIVEQSESKRIVVDNIAPTATVAYNTPVNEENGISYYDGDIHGTITINEANFYADDVSVLVSRDGGAAQALATSWSDSSVDTHVGTFTLTDDADYIVTINYRDKSGNTMTEYQSNQLTIDTKIEEPTYTINGVAKSGDNGGAYKDAANIGFSFEDQNFDTQTVKLIRTRFNDTKDVTAEFIKVGLNDKGGSGSFDIAKKVDNDGIYVLTVTMKDKAGHSTESHVKFTINRFGSVYEYSDYLSSLIKDGGQYIAKNGDAAITDDLVITEYNADRIVRGSLKIVITRDGETIDTKFAANPEASDSTAIGSSGWYQYVYTISKDNFIEDGVYNITITSEDATGNTSTSVPDNSIDKNGDKILDVMTFTVDTTAPEIRNIVGLDKKIVNAQEQLVKYTIVDVGGLKQVEVVVNGQTVDTITDFGDDLNSFSGEFTLSESNDAQTVQIKVTDLAGNITDTASDDFNPGELYVFNDVITVSTNFFVRWYANTALFWGSIGGVVVVTAAIWIFIAAKRKKEIEEK